MLHASPSSFVILPALAKIVCEPGWKWQKERSRCKITIYSTSGAGRGLLCAEECPIR